VVDHQYDAVVVGAGGAGKKIWIVIAHKRYFEMSNFKVSVLLSVLFKKDLRQPL